MTTRFDDEADDPELAPDDPLAVILAPPSDYLAPPPGSYDTIRRRANRRRLVRTAIGAGATCAVALLVALPLHLATPDGSRTPAPPLAPPRMTDRTTPSPSPSPPSPSETPSPSASRPRTASPTPTVPPRATTSEPTESSGTGESRSPSGLAEPTAEATAVPSVTPTGVPTRGVAGSEAGAAGP
ncbi:hypothetical protein ABZZ80_01020 [Streptomyces sp. NPDC006356]